MDSKINNKMKSLINSKVKKRILILAANPKKESFITTLAETYQNTANKNNDVRLLHLSDMAFNIDLSEGYANELKLEDALKSFQELLKWCDHFVIFTPIWWGAFPAKLKGLIDRTFLPGFAFQYEKGKLMPQKLLLGKTARIVMTMDTPPWYYVMMQGSPAVRQLKTATLKFVGFTSVKSKMFGPVISSTTESRLKWIDAVSKLGFSAN